MDTFDKESNDFFKRYELTESNEPEVG